MGALQRHSFLRAVFILGSLALLVGCAFAGGRRFSGPLRATRANLPTSLFEQKVGAVFDALQHTFAATRGNGARSGGYDLESNRTIPESLLEEGGLEPERDLEGDGERELIAVPPPRQFDAAGTVIYLHGIHGRPENGCPWMREGAATIGWLICPRGNSFEPSGKASWLGPLSDELAVVRDAEEAAQVRGADASKPPVIVGFSQGAYLTMKLVHARRGRYSGLVLIGADVAPTVEALRDVGVSRIVLGAGQADATYRPLKHTFKALLDEGFEAQWLDLGNVGHTYVGQDPAALSAAIAWAGGARTPTPDATPDARPIPRS